MGSGNEDHIQMAKNVDSIEVPGKTQEEDKPLQEYLKNGEILVETSESVCPKCLRIINCLILFRENKVYMRKYCEEHGLFEVLIYSDADDYRNAARYNKPGKKPLHYQGSVVKGCPEDCGLCEAHQQHTCVGVIEITDRCNLECPVCFADAKGSFTLPFERIKELIDLYVTCEGEPEVLQISGGEPTLHPDIFRILEYGSQKGIKFPMLNTNGLKLANRAFAEKIALTVENDDLPIGKPLIYLQFDGLSDDTYGALRGRPLLDLKMQALENCRELGMTVALVPTIVKGVNEHEIGPIIDLALSDRNIKTVDFQPVTLVGRCNVKDSQTSRMTIPEILSEIEKQTGGLLTKNSFINLPCPYPTCSVYSYIYKSEKGTIVLTELFDADNMRYIVNRAVPYGALTPQIQQIFDTFLSAFTGTVPGKTEKATCPSCNMLLPGIREFVDNITYISVHAFMDEYTFDSKRARKCCVTEILPNGQMIPFCVYNILYRKHLIPTFGNMSESG